MKRIALTRGTFAMVDERDNEALSQYKWHLHSCGYACRAVSRGGRRTILMHRQILTAPTGIEVDHINRDRLDNRRQNLRLATHSQNHMNQAVRVGRFKGVHPNQTGGKPWIAMIGLDGRAMRIGAYQTEAEAAKAYNQKAIELFGEFARLNEIETK